jgi:energy-coupling factor transport system ATP-binding protein
MTTIVVEHKTELLVQYCDRLCVLRKGEVVGLDEPKRLFRKDSEEWGVETPRYAVAYRGLFPDADDAPVTLEETTQRLNSHARG